VADASASMTGKGGNMRPWRIAERSFATVIQAAREFRNRIEIYAYFGKSKTCTLTRLYHGNRLYTITPYGDTPSGQAIMAAATMLDRKYKKNMIIHITDGAPNSGIPLKDAVSYCENKGIQVFTIGCGCTPFTQQFLKDTFPPGHVYLMKGIDNLAEGLETLFKQRILKQV
jgi:Mg-chelatase subunit ChlD